MTPALEWTAARCAGAPTPLVERVMRRLREVGATEDVPSALAEAATAALEAAVAGPSGREAAADVLAADALVTLALQAQAEHDPAGLPAFAEALRARVADRA